MAKAIIDLSAEIASLKLKNPIIISSGCLEYSEELKELIPIDQFAAYTTKTITFDKREGNLPPRTCEVAWGLMNSIGLQNEGLYYYIKKILPKLKNLMDIPIITSISGFSIEEFAELASHLDREKDVSALEVNISCPNLEKGTEEDTIFAHDTHLSYGVVKAVRESTTKPVIVKLAPNVTDIKTIALAVVDAGCDAITVANTYPALAIDVKTRQSKLGSLNCGLSGPAIKPMTVKKLWEVYRTVKVPLIASGGVMNTEDALEYIIAGATFVSLGTVNFINPKAIVEILAGIQEYLKENKLTYKGLIGSLKIEAL